VQRLLGFAGVFFTIIACVSGAEAIDIYFAEVKNGGAFVQGDKAVAYSTITWERQDTVAANRAGGFTAAEIYRYLRGWIKKFAKLRVAILYFRAAVIQGDRV